MNRIYRSCNTNHQYIGDALLIRNKFVQRLYEESVRRDQYMRQIFVFMTHYTDNPGFFSILSQLQNERNWEVIIYWDSKLGRRTDTFIKMPVHRIVCKNYEPYNNLSLKNLFDVIKEPNFNRYDLLSITKFRRKFLH